MTDFAKNENETARIKEKLSSDELKTILSIGVSGKRYVSKDEQALVYNEIKDAIEKILNEHSTDQFIAYTAIASGTDTIFADVVRNEFHQPLQVILPFPVEEYKKDFEENEVNKFRNLVKEYGISKTINTELPIDSETRNTAYYEVGKYIVDETDEMIFVWDGLKPGGKGGTAEIMGYFSEKRPEKKIRCIMIKPKEADTLNDLIVEKYQEEDLIAVKKRNVYRMIWKAAIVIGWLAALLLAINTAFEPVKYELRLVFAEFVCVLAVLILVFRARKKHYHRSYLDHRMKAEIFRLLRSFYHAGVKVTISEETKKNDKELAFLANESNEKNSADDKRSKWYSQYVIKSLIEEQSSYHENKISAIGNKYLDYEGALTFVAIAFFLNLSLFLAYLFLRHCEIVPTFVYLHEIHIFLSIVLPAIYAGLEGFVHFNDWNLLKKYSEFAKSGLKESEEQLRINLEQHSSEECYKKQSEVLNLVSGIMLSDNRNWSLLLENKDAYTMIV